MTHEVSLHVLICPSLGLRHHQEDKERPQEAHWGAGEGREAGEAHACAKEEVSIVDIQCLGYVLPLGACYKRYIGFFAYWVEPDH